MSGFRSSHFGLKPILISAISQRLFANYTYTIRHGLAIGMKRKGGLGFLPFGPAGTKETEFLEQLPLEGKVVYDIGAFEGVLTLFFAKKARQVISYEPNPRNYRLCIDNVNLNHLSSVQVLNRGVSDQAGSITLVYDPLTPGAGSGNASIAEQIGSSVKSARTLEIPVVPLDDDIRQNALPAPDVIKIDIEGLEYKALLGMRETLARSHPALFIEMHGATHEEKAANIRTVTEYLGSLKYKTYDVEHSRTVTAETFGDLLPRHLYCTPA